MSHKSKVRTRPSDGPSGGPAVSFSQWAKRWAKRWAHDGPKTVEITEFSANSKKLAHRLGPRSCTMGHGPFVVWLGPLGGHVVPPWANQANDPLQNRAEWEAALRCANIALTWRECAATCIRSRHNATALF